MKILKGNNLVLRPLEPKDVDLLYQWENNTDVWRISNTLVPFSKHILKKYIESTSQEIYTTKQIRFIIDKLETTKQEIKSIGTIDLFDFDAYHLRAGIGILITEKERNKGYADEVLKIIIHYSFNHLYLNQLYCNIETDNKSSLKLFEKNNFRISGEKKNWNKTLNGWKNEYFLQLLNE